MKSHRYTQLLCRRVQAHSGGCYGSRAHRLRRIQRDFLKAYPDIKVRLILTDRMLSLFEEQIDVALRVGALSDSSMIAIRVGAVRRMICASPDCLAARGTPRMPDDLAGHDCITHAGLLSPDVWTFVRDKTSAAT